MKYDLKTLGFEQIWLVDFEFHSPDGSNPTPICMIAREVFSGKLIRLWHLELNTLRECPFSTNDKSLVVAFAAAAEWSCFLQLGWGQPRRALDLMFEYRALSNGTGITGDSLLAVLPRYGISAMEAAEKDHFRNLCISGEALRPGFAEKDALLDYCQEDVDGMLPLLERMAPQIFDPGVRATVTGSVIPVANLQQLVGQALFRGRYSWAVAVMEHNGVPVDDELLAYTMDNWTGIQHQLIDSLEADHGIRVYDDYKFKIKLLEDFLIASNIPWPRTKTGALSLKDDTFKDTEKVYPLVAPIRAIRKDAGQLRLHGFTIGPDGRNRSFLAPFRSKTGRNQPSNARSIFFAAAWLRSFIKPKPGTALAYIDWSSQEVAVAAALSGDAKLLAAYESGDVYMAFLRQAGMVSSDATKNTHPELRTMAKICVLGTQFGMGPETMAVNMGKSPYEAKNLIKAHERTYQTYWQWSSETVDTSSAGFTLITPLGWQLHPHPDHRPTTLKNWKMQATGSDMMRLAACMLVEAGIKVCLPVHDAFLVEADEADIDEVVRQAKNIMEEASRVVLNGKVTVKTDAKIFRQGERFVDEGRGILMWDMVMRIIGKPELCFGTEPKKDVVGGN